MIFEANKEFMENLSLHIGNLFKLVRFAITFARAVCHWG